MKKKQRAFQARFMEHMKKKMEEMKFEDNNKSLNLNGGSTVAGANPEDENRTPLGALRPATSAPQATTVTQPRPTTTASTVSKYCLHHEAYPIERLVLIDSSSGLPQSQGLAARAKATTVTPVNILKPANNGSRSFNVFVDDEFSEKKPQTTGAALKIPSMPGSSSSTFAIPSLPASKPSNPALAMPPGLGLGSNTNTSTSAPKPLSVPQR